MEESLEQSELEAAAENRADLRRLTRKEVKSELVIPLFGLVVGLSLFSGGFFFLLQGVVLGLLVFFMGLLIVAISLLGGLGRGAYGLMIGRRGLQPRDREDVIDKVEMTFSEKWRAVDKTERDEEERQKEQTSD